MRKFRPEKKRGKEPVRRRVLSVLWLTIDLMLVAIFTSGYLAAYIHPRYWWWGDIVAVGLPYVALLVAVASFVVFIAARRRRGLLFVHALVLLLVVVRFAPTAGWKGGPAVSDSDLVVMTLNLPRYSETDNAADRVVEIVETHRPHLVGIQESTLFSSVARPRIRAAKKLVPLIDDLGYEAPIPTNRPPGRSWTNWYQPVLGRIRILDQKQIEMPYEEDDIRPMRALRTEFEWEGRKAVHYNLHLYTFGSEKPWSHDNPRLWDVSFWKPYILRARRAFVRRAWQSEHIRELIDAETLPVLISGDFNGTPHNWSSRKIATGFQDAFALSGEGWGGTYHTRFPLFRIDFVLADEHWEVVSSIVPRSDREVSDHRPLVARLRWRAVP